MTQRDSLLAETEALISRRSEGAYWDFKRCHHTKDSDLIHNVLCLANVKHNGGRFLVFGVKVAIEQQLRAWPNEHRV